jgi:phosphoribosylformimino-5-aminoimidazole carboxamide ribonucleotide (ProFAR) isomerase
LGAERVIVGTAAFTATGPNRSFLAELTHAVPQERILLALDSKGGRIVVKGWRESLNVSAEEIIHDLEPWCGGFLCTYVDKEGMMQGTDLEWFRRLRASTSHEITAAGGITTIDDIRALDDMGIHSALGMAIYTGRLNLEELAGLKQNTSDLQSMNGGVHEDGAGERAAGQDRPRLLVDDGQGARD